MNKNICVLIYIRRVRITRMSKRYSGSVSIEIVKCTVADRHLEFKKKIKVLEYGFMLILNILEPGVKSTKNIQIEGVHIEYFCSMLS